MKTISLERASQLAQLVEEVTESAPLHIHAGSHEAVLVSAEEWRGIQETLYLQAIPGVTESILEAMQAPPEEFSDEPLWE